MKLFLATLSLAVHAALFYLAIKHRHDSSGIVWALLWIGEQIHMTPPWAKK